jgi:amidase
LQTNCLTEIAFDTALHRAAELDAHLARTGELIGPLHGLPISVKDQFDIAGLDSTMGAFARGDIALERPAELTSRPSPLPPPGFVSLIGKPAERHSVLVELLLSLGAVIHCKVRRHSAPVDVPPRASH